MTRRRALPAAAFALLVAAAAGPAISCGPSDADVLKTVAVTDALGGWYDFGVTPQGNKLVPSITFKLKNTGTRSIGNVQVMVSFWLAGDDGETDSTQVRGIGDSLAPGAATEPIQVNAAWGFTIAAPRAEAFTNSRFRDATAKIFGKRGGKIVPLGEFKLERRIVPHARASSHP
ncbi:MAG TPA: hypothetical protein VFV98_04890 [Vicinamibacterales bacterium]|nr:hypothetical protein [Vicinamibacterales bacterium]